MQLGRTVPCANGAHYWFSGVARRATREAWKAFMGLVSCLVQPQAPPRPPREDPTPFPREPIFPPEPLLDAQNVTEMHISG